MRFRAKVISDDAQVELLELEAANDHEARQFVESRGGKLLTLTPQVQSVYRFARGTNFNLMVFNRQLYALLQAGQSIVDAIDILGGNDKSGRNRAIYDTLLHALRQGKQLSQAMESLPAVFPSLYIAMIRSSETTGTVRSSVLRYMHYQKQLDGIRSKLISAGIYPAILLVVGFMVIAFLMLHVVPRFSEVFNDLGQQQTGVSGLIQQWGAFVQAYPAFAWAGFLTIGVGLSLLFLRAEARVWLFQKLLTTPWVGNRLRTLQLARLYRTLSMLLRSGVALLTAMRMAEESLPKGMQLELREAAQGIKQGRKLSEVMMASQLTTEVAYRLLLAGESSGNLDEMLEHIADFYDQEIAGWIDIVGRMIEPALMVFIGLVIGGIVLALYVPIFDLANAVQ
jgi:general secretion pathway protein F